MHSRHGIGRTTKLVTVVAALATTIGVVGVASAGAQAAPRLGALTALPGSLPRTTDHVIGNYRIGQMQVEVALAPRNARGLQNEIRHTYVKSSKTYHHWLSKGQFAKRYAPSVQVREAVARYLKSEGLRPVASGSAFLMRAVGSSAQVASTFHTTLSVYQDPRGDRYYSNSSVVRLPSSLTKGVLGVIGLTNTIRDHTNLARLPYGHSVGSSACQTGYVTAAELFNLVDNNVGFPYGYGGGPGCSGLTPSQTNGLYGAPGGTDTTGKGVTTAVFELSAYQQSDIAAWTNEFYGPGYKAPLQNVLVDGGPLAPICPAADLCPANYNGYSGDIEVDADIQMTLDVAPATKKLQVYEAPNDYSGQTELDLYTAIANQDTADTVSSSWGVCENDITAPYAQAENVIFEQMALQGQSMFNSAGDTGAFGCLRSDGTTIVDAEDPATQPWVTSVGGTSFTFDNPATNANPTYPHNGDEMVWNVDNLCNASANEGGFSGLFWCGATGAGGGGISQWWGRPFYQFGPGVQNSYSEVGNGTTQCALAKVGTPCREGPDVSADADPYTGYAEYCTANASTPYSSCGFSSGEPSPGWFEIGGTSLSTPLWAALTADRDGHFGFRQGNINVFVYLLATLPGGGGFFHDITGVGQSMNNDGVYPTTPGYDIATGLGSPDFATYITKLI